MLIFFFLSWPYIHLMGKIKSALELAMERTENIAVDEEKIRQREEDERIKRIAGEYLAKEENDDAILKRLDDFDDDALRRSLRTVLVTSLSLPAYDAAEDRYSRLEKIMRRVLKDDKSHLELYKEVLRMLSEYPKRRKELIDAIEKQLEPALMQKSQEMSKRLGRQISLTIEDDKEALEILEKNLEQLEKQYSQGLEAAKKRLEKAF